MKIDTINIYACPNAGKSVAAALAYGQLASMGVSIELVREVHKEYLAQTPTLSPEATLMLYEKQCRRMERARRLAERIVTDCPRGLCGFYAERAGMPFFEIPWEQERRALNILINPDFDRPYDMRGRVHTQGEQRKIQNDLIDYLLRHGVDWHVIEARDIAGGIGKRILHLLEVNEK